jgi:serine/threonine protein kinase
MSVICSACGQTIDLAELCPACGEDPLLDGRYRLDEQIGRGASGITFQATRLADDKVVAVKELSYRAMQSFEMEKLFRREAKVLQQLDHPGIPEYIDDFTVESGKRLSLYLVQEFVDGETLEEEMVSRRYSEIEVLDILDELAGILTYLQEVRPAVFHRDIKPANVMRTGEGSLVLIDFGSVKATTDSSVGGSTVAGTFGYMAPEQHWGRATAQTDLYALGALALALLTRRDPSEFVGADHRLDWRDRVDASQPVEELLDWLLQDQLEARPEDASAARELIRRAHERLSSDRNSPPAATKKSANDWAVDASSPPDVAPASRPVSFAVDADETDIADVELTQSQETSSLVPVVGALVVLIGVVVAVFLADSDAPNPPFSAVSTQQPEAASMAEASAAEALEPHACKQQECTPLNVPFKDRLEFGMTVEEAKAARPELSAESIEGGVLNLGRPPELSQVQGTVLDADLAVLDKRARCSFSFIVDDGLSKIDCRIGGLSTRSEVSTYSGKLAERLASRYGLPTSSSNGGDSNSQFGRDLERRWQWKRDSASLEVSAEFNDIMANVFAAGEDNPSTEIFGEMAAKVQLTHATDAHDAALRRAAAEAAAERARQAAQRERQKRLEMQKLKELSEDDSL